MVTFRQMTEGDVPAAVAAFESGLLGIAAGHGLPVTGHSIQDERRRQDRTRHFLGTDPGGSWVAEEGEAIVGMSQSFVREDYWMLSQLGTVPGRQGRGVGRELLRLALSHGDPHSPGTIQCSRDPKAMALYTGFGFTLHPVVTAWGAIRPGAVARPPEVDRYETDEVGERELQVVTAIDRKVRGLGTHGRHRRDAGPAGEPPPSSRGPGLRRRQGRARRDPRRPAGRVRRPGAAGHAGRGASRER